MLNAKKWWRLSEYVTFLGPALFFFTLIVIIPFFMSMFYSFTDWNGVSSAVSWVGVKNFADILSDDLFKKDFMFTLRFTVISVALINLIGFSLALLLTRAMRFRNVYRTIFFLPNVIGGLLLGFIWQFIFVKGFASVGDFLHISFFQLPWLGDAPTAFWGLVIVTCWQLSGYVMVIYISSLTNIPKELLEAARIDGASKWMVLRRITIPLIMSAFTVCLFLSISWCFKTFDLNLALTKGGPFNSTESVALNIYYEAFRNNHFGLGTAKAVVFFVLVAAVTSIQIAYTKKKEVQA
jgi:raffinose/stachyose/melibiose transport system permease protein